MPVPEDTRARVPLGSIASVAAATVVIGMTFTLGGALRLEATLTGLLGFAILSAIVARLAAWSTDRFGAASRVTLLRAGLGCLIAGLLLVSGEGPSLSWTLAALVAAMLSLDALDGWLARRLDQSSAFGARFDLEIDALVLLVLTLLVWRSGQAGPWVLAIGLMRYTFVVCSRIWRSLRTPLPTSRRRQAICAVQGVLLLACLLPPVPPSVAGPVAAIALATLATSFAIDVHWLMRGPHQTHDG